MMVGILGQRREADGASHQRAARADSLTGLVATSKATNSPSLARNSKLTNLANALRPQLSCTSAAPIKKIANGGEWQEFLA